MFRPLQMHCAVLLALAGLGAVPCAAQYVVSYPAGVTPYAHFQTGLTTEVHIAFTQSAITGKYHLLASTIDDTVTADCRTTIFPGGYPVVINLSPTSSAIVDFTDICDWTGTGVRTYSSQATVDTVSSTATALQAKLPSNSRKMAGEGVLATDLDDVETTMSVGAVADLVERMIAARAFKPNPQLVWVLRRGEEGVGSKLVRRKRAGEAVTFYADARPLLADGESIVPESIAVTAGASDVTIDAESFDVLAGQIVFACAGGEPGEEAELVIEFETNLGQSIEATVDLAVVR